MPIPRLEGDLTRQQVIEEYAKWGWKKELVLKWVVMNGRTGKPELQVYKFEANALPCSNRDCATHQLTFVQLMPTGVMWTCAICRKTMGPLAFDDGRLIDRRDITLQEAWEIIKETGQRPPVGLKRIDGGGRFRIVG